MTVLYAKIQRQQRKEALKPITFEPVNWSPQVEVTFTQDVSGWLDRDSRVKWEFRAGQTAYVDEKHAVEFIVKGYATGSLPREVSSDERAEIRSVMTRIGMGEAPSQSRNGNG